jgi:hypothetical protein
MHALSQGSGSVLLVGGSKSTQADFANRYITCNGGAMGLSTAVDTPDFVVSHKTDDIKAMPGMACLHNLTQARFLLPSVEQYSEYQEAQGAGWLEGGFTSLAFVNSETATLRLQLNSTALPKLAVTVQVKGLPTHTTPQFGLQFSGSAQQSQQLTINISSWPDGEYTTLIQPDADSVSKGGWCGGIIRWLRKQTHPDAPVPLPHVALPAALNVPLLLFDDFWVWSRNGSQRRVIPAQLLKVSNQTFPAQFKPGTTERIGAGPWMMPIENPLGTGTVPITTLSNHSFSFNLALNHKTLPPASDPNASKYTCTASIEHSSTNSDVTWSCADHEDYTGTTQQPVTTTTQPQVSLPPFDKIKRVRWYNASTDGPVPIRSMSVWFNDLIIQEHDTVVDNVTFKLSAAYAYWTREVPAGHPEETLILPVNGARGPLLHGWEWGDKRSGTDARYNKTLQRGPCHSLLFGRPDGPQQLDTACIGDN